MPNVAAVLKAEVTRLARKEVSSQVAPLKKALAEHRRLIADLRRQLATVANGQRGGERRTGAASGAVGKANPVGAARFSPGAVAADRKRLGLSAKDYASLIGVSALTIYNWEHGRSKPQARPLAAWAAMRGIGKREAMRRLKQTPE